MTSESRTKPAPEDAPQEYAIKRRVLRRMEVERMLESSPPPVPWLASPVLVKGCLSLLTGRPGEGKSMLSQALAVAVASGSSVAGMNAKEGTVLVLDGENGRHELHRRVHSLGLPKEAASRFELYEADGFHLGRNLDWLEELLEEHRPSLLVLDSFRTLWAGGDENSSEEVAGVLDALRGLVRRHDTAGLLLHHLGKGGGAYRGSSAIAASCELAFKLDRAEGDGERERRRLSCFKSRPAAEPAPLWLRLEAREGRVLVTEAEPFEGTVTVADALQGDVLRAVTDGFSRLSDIAGEVGRGPKDKTVRRTLATLVEEGLLERAGKEYRLPQGGTVARPKGLDTLPPDTGEALTLAAIAGEEVAA